MPGRPDQTSVYSHLDCSNGLLMCGCLKGLIREADASSSSAAREPMHFDPLSVTASRNAQRVNSTRRANGARALAMLETRKTGLQSTNANGQLKPGRRPSFSKVEHRGEQPQGMDADSDVTG